jgi:hypothetical protein
MRNGNTFFRLIVWQMTLTQSRKALKAMFKLKKARSARVFSRRGIRLIYARFRIFFKQLFNDKFPALFFAGVFAAVVICVVRHPEPLQHQAAQHFAAMSKAI